MKPTEQTTKARATTGAPKRSVKWATGTGAAAVTIGALSALEGGPLTVLATIGALLLGVGIATEWRD